MAAILNGAAVELHFERGPPKDHLSQIWLNLVQRFHRRLKCDILSKYASFAQSV